MLNESKSFDHQGQVKLLMWISCKDLTMINFFNIDYSHNVNTLFVIHKVLSKYFPLTIKRVQLIQVACGRLESGFDKYFNFTYL